MKTNKRDGWLGVSILLLAIFIIFLAFPLMGLLKQSVYNEAGELSLENFVRFFTKPYYYQTLIRSLVVCSVTVLTTTIIGSVIGTHAGPGAVVVAFFKKKVSVIKARCARKHSGLLSIKLRKYRQYCSDRSAAEKYSPSLFPWLLLSVPRERWTGP